MKSSTVCSFLLSLFVVFVIASCSDSPAGPDEGFEPYRIGTWMVSSPTGADWEGEQIKAKTINAESDTVVLNSPDGRGLRIELRDSTRGEMFFTMIDSTFNTDSLINTLITISGYGEGNNSFNSSSSRSSIVNGNLEVRFGMSVNCRIPIDADNNITIDFAKRDTDQSYKKYIFVAGGYKDVIRDVICFD